MSARAGAVLINVFYFPQSGSSSSALVRVALRLASRTSIASPDGSCASSRRSRVMRSNSSG